MFANNNFNKEKIDLSYFDFSNLDKLDPSLIKYKLITSLTKNTIIQVIDKKGNSTNLEKEEPIDIKLYKRKNSDNFKIEISSDNDIYFFYCHM